MAVELSIIIPTLNRGRMFQESVRGLLGQRFADWELLVVDQSDPPGREANERFLATLNDARIRYVHLPVKGLPNARNEGIVRARGSILLFLDDDILFVDPGFLDAHLAPYVVWSDLGGVTGRVIERSVRPNARDTSAHISPGGRTITNLWGTERRFIESCKGANMSYRAEAVRQVGGFDRNYIGTALLEDTDYGYRVRAAGWRLLYEPAAELVHLSATTGGVRVEDALRGEKWRFRNTAYFVRKHRGLRGVPAFLATFGAIAAARAARWRDPAAARLLLDAAREGLAAAARGADEALPGGEA